MNYWNSSEQEFPNSLKNVINHLYQYGLRVIYFILWVIIQYSFIYVVIYVVLALSIGSFFSVGFYIPP